MSRFLTVLFILLCAVSIFGETIYVEGNVSGEWNADSVIVSGDLTISNGETLQIAPGTYIEFQGFYKLDVQGTLLALGTSTEQIIFTHEPVANIKWYGIKFNSTPVENDSSKIVHCILENQCSIENSDSLGGAINIIDFDKLLISNSILRYNKGYYYGGGMYCKNASPVIVDCIFLGNESRFGGGIYSTQNSSPKLIRNTFTNNNVDFRGGGFYCYQSQPEFYNCEFLYNETGSSYFSNGGGLACDLSNVIIDECIFDSNQAGNYGGGIECRDSSEIEIIACTITGCTSEKGAGVSITGYSCAIIEDNQILSNTATDFGGGLYFYSSYGVVSGNTISENSATNGYGGGISCWQYSSPVISDNIIYGNTAYQGGGGIECFDTSSPAIKRNYIYNNSSDSNGGGMYIGQNSSSYIYNNVICNNESHNGSGIYFFMTEQIFLTSNVICNNAAAGSGGAIYCFLNDNQISVNNIIYGNTANSGETIYLASANCIPPFYYCNNACCIILYAMY